MCFSNQSKVDVVVIVSENCTAPKKLAFREGSNCLVTFLSIILSVYLACNLLYVPTYVHKLCEITSYP